MGMHRSGTSMIAQLLGEAGLLLGVCKNDHYESRFFKSLNDWLMLQCGARWDLPQAVEYAWNNDELMYWVREYVKDILASPRGIQYTGLRSYLSGGIFRLNQPWGWKDPRNTFALPLWLSLFPDAKIICVERHGVDVAQSLLRRSQLGFSKTTKKAEKYKAILPLFLKKGGFMESPRCSTLSGGFSLWVEYMQKGREILAQLPDHNILLLRYESVLTRPEENLRDSARFCGLSLSDENLKRITATTDPDRAFAYLKDPVLRDFASQNEAVLQSFDYE